MPPGPVSPRGIVPFMGIQSNGHPTPNGVPTSGDGPLPVASAQKTPAHPRRGELSLFPNIIQLRQVKVEWRKASIGVRTEVGY